MLASRSLPSFPKLQTPYLPNACRDLTERMYVLDRQFYLCPEDKDKDKDEDENENENENEAYDLSDAAEQRKILSVGQAYAALDQEEVQGEEVFGPGVFKEER